MIVRNARVPIGTSDSEPLSIPDGYGLVRVEIPAAFTSTNLKLKVSVDKGSTHRASFAGTEYSQTVAPNQSHYIDPKYTLGANSVLLDLDTAEAAERNIPCVFEVV